MKAFPPDLDLVDLEAPLFVLGAAHAGKSELAIAALRPEQATTVIGTAVLQEELLIERVRLLQSIRPAHWQHVEAAPNLAEQIKNLTASGQQILLDSFNQWLANALLHDARKYSQTQIQQHFDYEFRQICDALTPKSRIVIVSSEVGAGGTPPQEMARLFRQLLGQAHVMLAKASSSVLWVTAGLPLLMKAPEQ